MAPLPTSPAASTAISTPPIPMTHIPMTPWAAFVVKGEAMAGRSSRP